MTAEIVCMTASVYAAHWSCIMTRCALSLAAFSRFIVASSSRMVRSMRMWFKVNPRTTSAWRMFSFGITPVQMFSRYFWSFSESALVMSPDSNALFISQCSFVHSSDGGMSVGDLRSNNRAETRPEATGQSN